MNILIYIIVGLVILVALFFCSIYLYAWYLDLQKRKKFDMLFPIDYKTKSTFKYLGKKYDKDKYLQYRIEKYDKMFERYSTSDKLAEAKRIASHEFHAEICYEMDREAKQLYIKQLNEGIGNRNLSVKNEISDLISKGDNELEKDIFMASANYYYAYFFLKSKEAEEKLNKVMVKLEFLVAFEQFRLGNHKIYVEQGIHFDYSEKFNQYVSYVYESLFNEDNFINKDSTYIEICVIEKLLKIINEENYKTKISDYINRKEKFKEILKGLNLMKCKSREELYDKLHNRLEEIIENESIKK